MTRISLWTLVILCILMLPSAGIAAQEEAESSSTEDASAEDEAPEGNAESEAETNDDPVTARLRIEVMRYYAGIGVTPDTGQVNTALDSARFMLMDGVSVDRITAAVDKALTLHNPGRNVSFEVAVPLRVLPAAGGTTQAGSSQPANEMDPESTQPTSSDDEALRPNEEASIQARAERKKREETRRNRLRLHRQWKKRTTEKRILLTVGVPTLAIPYSLGFFTASIMAMDGVVPRSWAFITTVPVVGTLLLGIWTEGLYPGLAMLTITQVVGLASLIVGLALRSEKPHEKDPTALRLGKKRDGSTAVTLRAAPMGLGGILQGRF